MKFTGPARIEYLISIFPDAIFVSITREPIATVRSWLEVGFWQRMGVDKLWWRGAYSEEEIAYAETLKDQPALITAFQYKKLMETTRHEIEKLGLHVYECRYEDFLKDPKKFMYNMMEFMQLAPSKRIDAYLQNMTVLNRNERRAKTAKTEISEEARNRILDITGPY